MTFSVQADLLCSALWDVGKFYTFVRCCDHSWAIFCYSSPRRYPRCVKSGLSMQQVVFFLKGVQNEKA